MSGSIDDLATLDPTVLEELLASVEDDRAFVVDLVEAYLADGAEHVAQLSASGSGDLDAAVRPAHTLKSSSATVGARRLAETARTIEMAARDGSSGDVKTALDRLPSEWSETAAALRAWLASA